MSLGDWEALPESERGLWLARQQRRRDQHDCGHAREVCADEAREWFPQVSVCYPTMHREAARASWERMHAAKPWHDGTFSSWVAEPDVEHPVHFSFGTTVWVASEDLGIGAALYDD